MITSVSVPGPAQLPELTIGALSSATGVPVDTLRTWERRYGYPVPSARSEGSHRRYSAETIGMIQLIVRALDLGHRASAVVGRAASELQQLIGQGEQRLAPRTPDEQILNTWVELTRALDGDGLTRAFHRQLAEMPAIEFLERCMGPYLVEIGAGWAGGQLQIYHEHFASEHARAFLSAQWQRLSELGRGAARARVVLATPPGERHVLGLHMAAWIIARSGAYVGFLGGDTPMAEIAAAARQYRAQGVVLSVAAGYRGELQEQLSELRARLPSSVRVAVGGAGSSEVAAEGYRLNGLRALADWSDGLE
jgi:DNA-binding transcriptional MerR regulator/methylmalonyl-CoA mutase cobalamin-binding subunit